jgi:hypothetical protein
MAVKTPQISEVFNDATASFNEAVKAGAKMQEEIGKWWTDALEKASPGAGSGAGAFALDDWQKKSKAVAAEVIPAAQKKAEIWLKLVDQNTKRGLGLLKKAMDAPPTDPAALRERTQEIWESSLELVRDNTQAIAQANLKMLEVWAGLLQKCGGNGKAS